MSRSPAFLGLPWELLRDPKRATPLALDLASIDRTLVIEGAAAPVPPGETLRVLMVIARPSGLKDVGYQMIARPLVERLSAVRGRVALDVLRPPTLEAMHKALGEAHSKRSKVRVGHLSGPQERFQDCSCSRSHCPANAAGAQCGRRNRQEPEGQDYRGRCR
jgi:hypothetical protein